MRVLVIDDDYDIAANITDFLEAKGHIPDFSPDGFNGLNLAIKNTYDVIVLDVMMPGIDGLTVCRKLNEKGIDTPVLMLTARDTLADKLSGFDSGADDYLVKPFEPEELEVRLKALSRRGKKSVHSDLKVDDLELNKTTLTVKRAGQTIDLNRACLKILIKLMEKSPEVVTRNEIENLLWGEDAPDSDALRSHIYTLRRKTDKPFEKALIHTIHGVGYKIE
ncbi:MAG: response regulator transcription factor [Desulfobacteraceae bacterium]|nr:response regulator transcription factor [Desulfobacteraceae bacterium]